MYILDWPYNDFQIVWNSHDDLIGSGLIAREIHCCIPCTFIRFFRYMLRKSKTIIQLSPQLVEVMLAQALSSWNRQIYESRENVGVVSDN